MTALPSEIVGVYLKYGHVNQNRPKTSLKKNFLEARILELVLDHIMWFVRPHTLFYLKSER